ncbi:MAG: PQQ-dependent sugar dehydrogenase [Actinobacteria bacterium]|nr:PQQ-dependent sugar dehydrogenase [Actinomycetota bacterium]
MKRGRIWRGVLQSGIAAVLLVGAIALAAFAQGCSGSEPTDSSPDSPSVSETTGPGDAAGEADLTVEVVAQSLTVPWEIRFFPDGALLVTERTGRVLRIDAATGAVSELGRLPVASEGEGGLLGAALDPGFPTQPYLYVAYTYRDGASGGLANRVSRLTLNGDAVGEEKVLVDGIPGAGNHNGSRVAFGPEGDLWVTTGDASKAELAQELGSLAGKVLRMDREGRPAAANPFGDSLVYSYGHRNPQGLAWLAGDPDPFVTEHGPNENDEVNHLQAGGNYGWPQVGGTGGGPEFVGAIHAWTPTIAPAGAVFYEADAIRGWRGSLLFVTLKESDLRRLVPTDSSFSAVAEEHILFDERFGRLRSIAVGPDGALYLGTSNRDGRGDENEDDDKILRITVR